MIDIKRLSPKILASAAFATFALGVGTIAATEMMVHSCKEANVVPSYVAEPEEISPLTGKAMRPFEVAMAEIATNGSEDCLYLAKNLAVDEANGELSPANGEGLVTCYSNAGDDNSAQAVAVLMSQVFPESAVFQSLIGMYQLSDGNYNAAYSSLSRGIALASKYGIDRENGAILNNNYAWLKMHAPNPDLNVVDYHSRRALALNSSDCSILHTRLSYEFTRVLNQGADRRDLENWVQVREPYVQCLIQFQSPRFRLPGNYFALDTISSQIVSSYVMDGLLLHDLDVDENAADYLAPARGTIAKQGPERFCYSSMGTSDAFVQGACLRTIQQAQRYWIEDEMN